MSDIVIKVENIWKEYHLGVVDGNNLCIKYLEIKYMEEFNNADSN